MHLFDANDKLKKYKNVPEIINDYYIIRLNLYQSRKEFMIDSLTKELCLLSNKSRYIQELLNDTIDLRKKKKDEVVAMLQTKNYDIINDDSEYKYLTRMPMDSVTEEIVAKIQKETGDKQLELKTIQETSIQQMWLLELDNLSIEYLKYQEDRQRLMSGSSEKKKSVVKNKKINLVIE